MMELKHKESKLLNDKNIWLEDQSIKDTYKDAKMKSEIEKVTFRKTKNDSNIDDISKDKLDSIERLDYEQETIFPRGFFQENVIEKEKKLSYKRSSFKNKNSMDKEEKFNLELDKKSNQVDVKNREIKKRVSNGEDIVNLKTKNDHYKKNDKISPKNNKTKGFSLLESLKIFKKKNTEFDGKELNKEEIIESIVEDKVKKESDNEELHKKKSISADNNGKYENKPVKLFHLEIPYRDINHIPSGLFDPKNATYPDFRHLTKYNTFIHETSKFFSVDDTCEYVYIKRKSHLDHEIQSVIDEKWNTFMCGKNHKNLEQFMSVNISEELLKDFDSKINIERIKNRKPLELPSTRIIFHANPIIKDGNKNSNILNLKKTK